MYRRRYIIQKTDTYRLPPLVQRPAPALDASGREWTRTTLDGVCAGAVGRAARRQRARRSAARAAQSTRGASEPVGHSWEWVLSIRGCCANGTAMAQPLQTINQAQHNLKDVELLPGSRACVPVPMNRRAAHAPGPVPAMVHACQPK